MDPDRHLPLPPGQYQRYVLFWSLLMVGALVAACVLVVWKAHAAWTWRETVTIVLLLMQLGSYAVLVGKKTFPPMRRLILYFAVNLTLWAVEYWLVPSIWWVLFAYMGQMYGMLPLRAALLFTLAAATFFFGQTMGWRLQEVRSSLLYAAIGQWVGVTMLLVYMNHLAKASRERAALITRLEAAQKELEVARHREAELAVLRERERLARDLHDSLGHTLVALSVQLEAIQRLYRVDPERASAQVDEMKVLTRSSMDALRRSVAGLRAPGLGDRPLRAALQALCVDLGQRTGIEVECQVAEDAEELSPALSESLWRVAQEALTNVEKHARARRVRLALQRGPRAVLLRVADDGIGLPAGAESSPNHFGLRGMRERVEGLGGTLSLRRDEGSTVVEASLPVIASGAPSSGIRVATSTAPGER